MRTVHLANTRATERLWEPQEDLGAQCTSNILLYVAFDNKTKAFN